MWHGKKELHQRSKGARMDLLMGLVSSWCDFRLLGIVMCDQKAHHLYTLDHPLGYPDFFEQRPLIYRVQACCHFGTGLHKVIPLLSVAMFDIGICCVGNYLSELRRSLLGVSGKGRVWRLKASTEAGLRGAIMACYSSKRKISEIVVFYTHIQYVVLMQAIIKEQCIVYIKINPGF